MTSYTSVFIKYIPKPTILVLVYLFTRDFSGNIPYVGMILKPEENKVVVIWIAFLLLYFSSLSINKIVVAIVFFLLLNLLNIQVGGLVFVSLLFISFYYFKQMRLCK